MVTTSYCILIGPWTSHVDRASYAVGCSRIQRPSSTLPHQLRNPRWSFCIHPPPPFFPVSTSIHRSHSRSPVSSLSRPIERAHLLPSRSIVAAASSLQWSSPSFMASPPNRINQPTTHPHLVTDAPPPSPTNGAVPMIWIPKNQPLATASTPPPAPPPLPSPPLPG